MDCIAKILQAKSDNNYFRKKMTRKIAIKKKSFYFFIFWQYLQFGTILRIIFVILQKDG